MAVPAVLTDGLYEEAKKDSLQQRLLQLAFVNLMLVASLGLLLRSFPFLNRFPLLYKNVLHGHSHFAFGGWVLPVLLALLMKFFPAIRQRVAYTHWRNVGVLALLAAYGMLLAFPVQGYKGVSITFSTLSIAATTYFSVVVWQAMRHTTATTAHRFVLWGLVYATLSAIGPFATVPLIIKGQQGTPLYFDWIYFYLHFQYNGFFTFFVLALFYRNLGAAAQNGRRVFYLFNAACLPAYALSVLWHQPGILWNIVGGAAALLQLLGFWGLWKDLKKVKTPLLHRLSFGALLLKLVLQLLSAVPALARLAYQQRNFVIAYLHLALLGFISLFVFGQVWPHSKKPRLMKLGLAFFLFAFATTEIILVLQPLLALRRIVLPAYAILLLVCSLPFFIGAALMALAMNERAGTGRLNTKGKTAPALQPLR